tara:strand:- start:970 stop:1215 length:246 start_codon:yes stop_codon:yes gene_type:complete
MNIMQALKIMCDHFDDDRQLGRYIRMLTDIPQGSLDIDGFRLDLDRFKTKHFADDFHEGRNANTFTLDELLKNTGIRKNEE